VEKVLKRILGGSAEKKADESIGIFTKLKRRK
jgi:hypothetical protein